MGLLTYDVAVSLDGYIAGPGDDVTNFPMTGEHVDAYLQRMQGYQAVLMGRNTYEFGYQHGLEPGQAPYADMDNYVLSTSLQVPADAQVTVVRDRHAATVAELKERYAATYLCGGGALAGSLLQAGLVDRLCLKVAPIVLGGGTPLFVTAQANSGQAHQMILESATAHNTGVTTLTYQCTR